MGRETELGRLTGLIDDLGSNGSGLIVRGEAGIGKSALLASPRTATVTGANYVIDGGLIKTT